MVVWCKWQQWLVAAASKTAAAAAAVLTKTTILTMIVFSSRGGGGMQQLWYCLLWWQWWQLHSGIVVCWMALLVLLLALAAVNNVDNVFVVNARCNQWTCWCHCWPQAVNVIFTVISTDPEKNSNNKGMLLGACSCFYYIMVLLLPPCNPYKMNRHPIFNQNALVSTIHHYHGEVPL